MDDIRTNVTNRNEYKNENIFNSGRGDYAYVNSKGILKWYEEKDDYDDTKNKNGCGDNTPKSVTGKFSTLKLYEGTKMVNKQSCGYENTYVKYDFPASSTPDWLVNARSSKPSASTVSSLNEIKTEMTKIGQAGYVDMDTQFHSITPTFKNTYNDTPIQSYITGTSSKMISCSPNTVDVTYGSKIILLNNVSSPYYFTKNSTNHLEKNESTYTELFILPTSTSDTIGSNVKYNDFVYLSMYNSVSSCSDECKVGGINYSNEFILGSNMYKSPLQLSHPSTTTSGSIKLTDPFTIESIVNFNRMKEGDILTAYSSGLKSKPDNNGNIATLIYRDGSVKLTKNNIPTVVNLTGRVGVAGGSVTFTNGKLVIKNGQGVIKQTYPSQTLLGTKPYALYVYSDGLVGVVDANDTVMWKSSTTLDIDSSEHEGYTVYGDVVDNKLSFVLTASTSNTFKMTNTTYLKTTGCDVSQLKKNCSASDTCAGIIYSSSDNKWMKITNDSSNVSGNYTVTDSGTTSVYLRNMEPNISDSSCPDSTNITTSLSYSYIQGYPSGKAITTSNGTEQCSHPTVDLTSYTDGNDDFKEKLKSYENIDLTNKLKSLSDYNSEIVDNQSLYDSFASLFKEGDTNVKTKDQQIKDTEVIKSQEKTIALIWGIVTVSMFLIIVFRPRLNTT